MKNINLTKSEVETLEAHLRLNPCSSRCLLNYKRISCNDIDENGNYKCKIRRDVQSILNKLNKN